jgi:hypothetical protein
VVIYYKKKEHLSALQILQSNLPFGFFRQPFDLLHLLPWPEIFVDMVLPSDPLPILTDLMTLSKLFRPLRVRLESGLIDMRRDIASHAGIRVLKPGASHIGILVIDPQVQSGQLSREQYPRCNTR